MSRRNSPDDRIIAYILAALIIIGFIIKVAQALVLPVLFIAVVFLALYYYLKDDNCLTVSVICFLIFFVCVAIGFIFGNSEIGKQSQEIYALAVNTSKIFQFNPSLS